MTGVASFEAVTPFSGPSLSIVWIGRDSPVEDHGRRRSVWECENAVIIEKIPGRSGVNIAT